MAAAIPFYAPVDLEADTARRGGLSLSLRDLFGRSYQVDDRVIQILREASPINYVHAGLPPFLLVHGTADMSVPYTQSVQLLAKLKAAGVSCDLITIDDGVHGMARWDATDPTYKNKVVRWIADKLGLALPGTERISRNSLTPFIRSQNLIQASYHDASVADTKK